MDYEDEDEDKQERYVEGSTGHNSPEQNQQDGQEDEKMLIRLMKVRSALWT